MHLTLVGLVMLLLSYNWSQAAITGLLYYNYCWKTREGNHFSALIHQPLTQSKISLSPSCRVTADPHGDGGASTDAQPTDQTHTATTALVCHIHSTLLLPLQLKWAVESRVHSSLSPG